MFLRNDPLLVPFLRNDPLLVPGPSFLRVGVDSNSLTSDIFGLSKGGQVADGSAIARSIRNKFSGFTPNIQDSPEQLFRLMRSLQGGLPVPTN